MMHNAFLGVKGAMSIIAANAIDGEHGQKSEQKSNSEENGFG